MLHSAQWGKCITLIWHKGIKRPFFTQHLVVVIYFDSLSLSLFAHYYWSALLQNPLHNIIDVCVQYWLWWKLGFRTLLLSWTSQRLFCIEKSFISRSCPLKLLANEILNNLNQLQSRGAAALWLIFSRDFLLLTNHSNFQQKRHFEHRLALPKRG
jgi:hypothetical protein